MISSDQLGNSQPATLRDSPQVSTKALSKGNQARQAKMPEELWVLGFLVSSSTSVPPSLSCISYKSSDSSVEARQCSPCQ